MSAQASELRDGDVIVVASKVVPIAEGRFVDLADVTPSPAALALSARTGKPAEVVQLILDESSEHFVAGEHGPIIARRAVAVPDLTGTPRGTRRSCHRAVGGPAPPSLRRRPHHRQPDGARLHPHRLPRILGGESP
ncbi:coenzyme F420-0:L-glutamate ligase [Streptomyces violascens]|uniref:coenzyme F420-0:L-glutamate ligase n=1 Tax=Streptomyces violascens TaxID=67381 RepID=UPI001E4C37A4